MCKQKTPNLWKWNNWQLTHLYINPEVGFDKLQFDHTTKIDIFDLEGHLLSNFFIITKIKVVLWY